MDAKFPSKSWKLPSKTLEIPVEAVFPQSIPKQLLQGKVLHSSPAGYHRGILQSSNTARRTPSPAETTDRTSEDAWAEGDAENRKTALGQVRFCRRRKNASHPAPVRSSEQSAQPAPLCPGFFIDHCGNCSIHSDLPPFQCERFQL